MIGGLAYHFTSCSARGLKLRENVLLLKTVYLAEVGAERAVNAFDMWKGHISHLGIYEYAYPTTIPRFQLYALQKLAKNQASWGGNFYYGEVYPDWQIEGPKYWIMTQILWDNDVDIDGLLEEYCRELFGKAWEPMFRYWKVCSRIWRDARERGVPVSPWVGLIPRGLAIKPYIGEMKKLLEEARELAEDELVRKRIESTSLSLWRRI